MMVTIFRAERYRELVLGEFASPTTPHGRVVEFVSRHASRIPPTGASRALYRSGDSTDSATFA